MADDVLGRLYMGQWPDHSAGFAGYPAGTFQQSVKSYEPSWRDSLAALFMGEKPTPLRRQRVARMIGSAGAGTQGMAPVDFVPGVGQALGVNEAYREGDAQGMGLAVVPAGVGKSLNVAKNLPKNDIFTAAVKNTTLSGHRISVSFDDNVRMNLSQSSR